MKKIERECLCDLAEDWVDEGVRHGAMSLGYIGEIAVYIYTRNEKLTRAKFMERLEKEALRQSKKLIKLFDADWKNGVEELADEAEEDD